MDSAAAPARPSRLAVVVFKVSVNGTTTRIGLPLSRCTRAEIEHMLDTLFPSDIPDTRVVQRYSDSSATYITLDSDHSFRQLYRAAKAKNKVKLRILELPEPEAANTSRPLEEPTQEPVQESFKVAADAAEHQPEHLETVSDAITDSAETLTISEIVTQTPVDDHSEEVFEESSEQLDSTTATAIPDDTQPTLYEGEPEVSDELTPENSSAAEVTSSTSEENARIALAKFRRATVEAIAAKNNICYPNGQLPTIVYPASGPAYQVRCNVCKTHLMDKHWHCHLCNNDDFDICDGCVDKGERCLDKFHVLRRREVIDNELAVGIGKILSSDAHPMPVISVLGQPAHLAQDSGATSQVKEQPARSAPSLVESVVSESSVETCQANAGDNSRSQSPPPATTWKPATSRICNNCVREFSEILIVHCNQCRDFDLCFQCAVQAEHGHHPEHKFSTLDGSKLPAQVDKALCTYGARTVNRIKHAAVCDGCECLIFGVRYKCLECPDFDYCGTCHPLSGSKHPHHKFVAVHEPSQIKGGYLRAKPAHVGVYCDGEFCAKRQGYIKGERFKCTVCYDFDLCASCEAHPLTKHSPNHPMIKIRTPLRECTVISADATGALADELRSKQRDHSATQLPSYSPLRSEAEMSHRMGCGTRSSHLTESPEIPTLDSVVRGLDNLAVDSPSEETSMEVEEEASQEAEAEETEVEETEVEEGSSATSDASASSSMVFPVASTEIPPSPLQENQTPDESGATVSASEVSSLSDYIAADSWEGEESFESIDSDEEFEFVENDEVM